MSRTEEIIAKFELRKTCLVRNVEGQKMDEDCILKFIEADPSGNGKYLEWMFLMAGGGKDRMDKSIAQWEKGDHGEPPVRETLKDTFIAEAMNGYKDDDGKPVPPVGSQQEADAQWREAEPRLRRQHVYGDEDYAITGFGFYRSWPGHNSLYEHIVQTVRRFHRYQQALRAGGKSTDLSISTYPNLRDLMDALQDLTLLELKNDVVADLVFEDDNLVVVAPLNIGGSIKFGIQKWCTSCESMMKTALAAAGPNRWKEYAKDSGLYYCKFKKKSNSPHLCRAIAIQIPHKGGTVQTAKFWNADDVAADQDSTIADVTLNFGMAAASSFKAAMPAVSRHHKNFPHEKLNLEAIVKG